MNRAGNVMIRWIALPVLAGALCLPAGRSFGQAGQGGPPPGPGGPDRAARQDGGPPDGGGGGPMGRPDRPDRMMGGPGGGRGPMPMPPEMQQVERMRGYLDLVDRFSKLAHDPSAAGVAAVITASDMLKPRGIDAAIDFFNKTLPNVKDPAIARAIRIQLVDLYRAGGQQDKAMEQLTELMTSSPTEPFNPTKGTGEH